MKTEKTFYRLVCVIAVFLFCCVLTGCQRGAYYLNIVENGQTEYVIIRSQNAKRWEIEAALRFRDTLKAVTGAEIQIKDDFEREGTDYVRTEKEIIIGSTNREDEFETDYDSIENGFSIFSSDSRLVILAGSAAGMDAALEQFFSDFFGIAPGSDTATADKLTELTISSDYKTTLKYDSSELPFLGIPLKDYTIVKDSGDYMPKRCCILLKELLTKISGSEPAVSEEKLGSGGNLMIKTDSTVVDGNFRISISGTDITISFADYYGFGAALEWLSREYESRGYFDFKDGSAVNGSYMLYLDKTTASDEYAFKRAGAVRVMFNNILWHDSSGLAGRLDRDVPSAERHRLTAEMAAVYRPDVFGMQEVHQTERSGRNGVVMLLADAGYKEAINPDVLGMTSSCTPIFYREDAMTLIASGFKIFDSQPTTHDPSKSMTWGVFESKSDGERFMLVSTHLCTEDDEIGALQATELIEVVNAVTAEYDCPVIVGGDFNAAYDEKTYKTFTETAGYLNARELAAVSTKVRSYQTYPEYDQKLGIMQPVGDITIDNQGSVDHIILDNTDKLTVNVFGVVVDECSRSASDHLPVFMDFDFITE